MSWSSLPVTVDAALGHDPGDRGDAGAADADAVDASELGGGQDLVGDRDPHARGLPAASRIIRASFSSASSGITPRGRGAHGRRAVRGR